MSMVESTHNNPSVAAQEALYGLSSAQEDNYPQWRIIPRFGQFGEGRKASWRKGVGRKRPLPLTTARSADGFKVVGVRHGRPFPPIIVSATAKTTKHQGF